MGEVMMDRWIEIETRWIARDWMLIEANSSDFKMLLIRQVKMLSFRNE